MKAIVLAAGRGSRLGMYTDERPKCLLQFGGISLLERQIDLYRRLGVEDIVVIRGYAAEKITARGIRYYLNPDYAQTNMVYSLFCAEQELQGDVIISYGDILFQDSVLDYLLRAPTHEISVIVDTLWEEYYQERFEKPFQEAESLMMDTDGRIRSIGKAQPDRSEVQAQYIGLIRLSDQGCERFREFYEKAKARFWDRPWQGGRLFQKAYMTDFLQALIDEDVPVYSVPVQHGWLEFDTGSDYQKALEWLTTGGLDRFYHIAPMPWNRT